MGSASARPIAIRSAGRISARSKDPTDSMPVMWSTWLVFRLVLMRHVTATRADTTRHFVCLQTSIFRLTAYTRLLC